jgi:two-component system response regulator YesN
MYKVFFADDEAAMRAGIRSNMNWETSGFTLAGEAPDGEMALSLMQDIAPDILITDVKMPFKDGLELARLTKQSMPWIKIVILSGHDEFEYARRAISVGVEEYLLKPVTSAKLFETLNRVARKIEEENEKERLERERLLGMADLSVSELIDMISKASKIIEELGGDPRRILSGYTDSGTLRKAVSDTEAARRITRSVLERAIDFRNTVTVPAYSDSIREAREYIHEHYGEQGLSLNAVAAAVNVSPNHFSAIFARETGENFINYVTRIRMEQAKSLLRTTKLRTADVAYEAGYSDSHYFSYVFKKHVGLTPREYRAM